MKRCYISRSQWMENQTRGVLPAKFLTTTYRFLNLSWWVKIIIHSTWIKWDCCWKKKKQNTLSHLFSLSAETRIAVEGKSSHESLENSPKRGAEAPRPGGTRGVPYLRARPRGPFIAPPIYFRLCAELLDNGWRARHNNMKLQGGFNLSALYAPSREKIFCYFSFRL